MDHFDAAYLFQCIALCVCSLWFVGGASMLIAIHLARMVLATTLALCNALPFLSPPRMFLPLKLLPHVVGCSSSHPPARDDLGGAFSVPLLSHHLRKGLALEHGLGKVHGSPEESEPQWNIARLRVFPEQPVAAARQPSGKGDSILRARPEQEELARRRLDPGVPVPAESRQKAGVRGKHSGSMELVRFRRSALVKRRLLRIICFTALATDFRLLSAPFGSLHRRHALLHAEHVQWQLVRGP